MRILKVARRAGRHDSDRTALPGDWRVIKGLTQPELAAAVKVATTTRRAIERADIRLTHANAVTLRNAPRHQRGGVPRGLSARPRAHPAPPACNSLTAKTCH